MPGIIIWYLRKVPPVVAVVGVSVVVVKGVVVVVVFGVVVTLQQINLIILWIWSNTYFGCD